MTDDQSSLTVYVPKKGTELRDQIASGSGIVGSPYADTGRLRLDFEGNLHGLPELERFADRVARAAERHTWESAEGEGYPTSACAYADRDAVVAVGTFHPAAGRVTVQKTRVLQQWLDTGRIPRQELETSRQ